MREHLAVSDRPRLVSEYRHGSVRLTSTSGGERSRLQLLQRDEDEWSESPASQLRSKKKRLVSLVLSVWRVKNYT